MTDNRCTNEACRHIFSKKEFRYRVHFKLNQMYKYNFLCGKCFYKYGARLYRSMVVE